MASEKTIKVLKKEFDDPEDVKTYAGTYILRRWRWGMKNIAVSKATKIDLTTMIPSIDTGLMNRETLACCIYSAPFDTNPKAPNYAMIDDFPSFLGDMLYREVMLLNRVIGKKRRKNS